MAESAPQERGFRGFGGGGGVFECGASILVCLSRSGFGREGQEVNLLDFHGLGSF